MSSTTFETFRGQSADDPCLSRGGGAGLDLAAGGALRAEALVGAQAGPVQGIIRARLAADRALLDPWECLRGEVSAAYRSRSLPHHRSKHVVIGAVEKTLGNGSIALSRMLSSVVTRRATLAPFRRTRSRVGRSGAARATRTGACSVGVGGVPASSWDQDSRNKHRLVIGFTTPRPGGCRAAHPGVGSGHRHVSEVDVARARC